MKLLENNFDRIAFIYDWLAFLVFGKSLERAQRLFLPQIPENARVLVIGGGTGKILPDVLRRNPECVHYLEKSGEMLRLARQRLKNPETQKVQFIHGDENHPVLQSTKYNVVITFFVLDVFDETTLPKVMETLRHSLSDNGIWLFADFNARQQSLFAKKLISLMYAFFRWTCHIQARQLSDFRAAFAHLNMQELQSRAFYSRMIESKIYQKTSGRPVGTTK